MSPEDTKPTVWTGNKLEDELPMVPWGSSHKAHLEGDEPVQWGILPDIGCKPFVGFALQGRDTTQHPKSHPKRAFVPTSRIL
jgi:hypothetical protein